MNAFDIKAGVRFVAACAWVPLQRLLDATPWPGVRATILNYHSVSPEFHPERFNIHPEEFELHLRWLRGNSRIVSLDTILASLQSSKPLPPNTVAVTFDDGYEDNHRFAWPLLRKYKAPAAFFIATGYIDGSVDFFPNSVWCPLSWNQIREMNADSLVTFGAHSHSHRSMGSLAHADAVADIKESKRRLEHELGETVRYFAYPNGQCADIPAMGDQILESLGFVAGFTTVWGRHHATRDRFHLPRARVDANDTETVLRLKINGGYDFLRPIHRFNPNWRVGES